MPRPNGQLDTAIDIVAPENIAFRYRVAGPFRRLPAYLIDLAIRIGIAALAAFALSLTAMLVRLPGVSGGALLVIVFLLTFFYSGFCEAVFNGQTPGKMAMGIRVVTTEGQPITAMQAVLRGIVGVVDAQPVILYQVGFWTAACNDRYQRLGDLVCGTMVIVEEQSWLQGVVWSGEPDAARVAEAIPANFQPSRTLARALALYVQRRKNFSRPRRLEIAGHLARALIARFDLPANTDADLLLCGLYDRLFAEAEQVRGRPKSPFAGPPSRPARPMMVGTR